LVHWYRRIENLEKTGISPVPESVPQLSGCGTTPQTTAFCFLLLRSFAGKIQKSIDLLSVAAGNSEGWFASARIRKQPDLD